MPVAKERAKVDPTASGPVFWPAVPEAVLGAVGAGRQPAGQPGAGDAGTHKYVVKPHEFADRLGESYGDEAAADVLPMLTR